MSNVSRFAPEVRADFPILQRELRGGNRLTYLDSGATAQLPKSVLAAMNEQMTVHNGAVNRGAHQLAEESSVAVEQARSAVARFIGAEADEIVWTKSTTESLNLLAYAFDNSARHSDYADSRFAIGPGASIVVTRAEHHANLVPWQELCRRTGAQLRWLDLDAEGRLDLTNLEELVDATTKVVAFGHVSNVTGAVAPVEAIVARAHEVGALVVLDACQSAPHLPLDVRTLDVDFAVFSGHKMYGPTGIGVLYGKRSLLRLLPPFLFGGSMVEVVTMEQTTYLAPPNRFEAGTLPVTEIVALGAAVEYLQRLGMAAVRAHEEELTQLLLDGIGKIPGVRVLGPTTTRERLGVVSFAVKGVHPHDVGQYLDSYGVAVRTGHHCAQPVHQFFGEYSSTRASLGVFNTVQDVETFLEALSGVRQFFQVETAGEMR